MSYGNIIPFGDELQLVLSLLEDKVLLKLKDTILFGKEEKWYEKESVEVSGAGMNYMVEMIDWELEFRRTGVRKEVVDAYVPSKMVESDPIHEFKKERSKREDIEEESAEWV